MFNLATLEQLQSYLNNEQSRVLIILHGELSWAELMFDQYVSFLKAFNPEQGDKLSSKKYSDLSSISEGINRTTYIHHLGTENQCLLTLDPTLNIDALAALSGTIVAGGICFVWRGNGEEDWARDKHFFGQRFITYHQKNDYFFSVVEDNVSVFNESVDHFLKLRGVSEDGPTYQPCSHKTNQLKKLDRYSEQHTVISKIVGHIRSDSCTPMVLTADRGRGKSAALAIVCAALLTNKHTAIELVITAPNRAALGVFYQHLSTQLQELLGDEHSISIKNGNCKLFNNSLIYLPVDQALIKANKKAFLMIDEAAGIPVYLLKELVSSYLQCIFSSTVHGYEGAGKGFTVKFLSFLNSRYKKYLSFHLNQPIRWHENDPLEQFLFEVCLLKADFTELDNLALSEQENEMVELSKAQLATNESILRQIFSILVTAHYQTKPSDLKMMLEHPSIQIFATVSNDKVLAVALAMNEGKLDHALIEAIKQGQRRIKSHFLPQSLLTQCLTQEAFNYSYLRIMRIAVHPQLQQQGLGQQLLSFIGSWAKTHEIDILGTSFAANHQVCDFWFKAGYSPVRIGFSADASSGEHSIMMLNGLHQQSRYYVKHLVEQFYHSFDYLLVDEYQRLSVKLVQLILNNQHLADSITLKKCDLSEYDIKAVTAYAKGQTQYSCVVMSLHRWLLVFLKNDKLLTQEDLSPLIARILMKHSMSKVCSAFQLKGKKALNQYMMAMVEQSLPHIKTDSP